MEGEEEEERGVEQAGREEAESSQQLLCQVPICNGVTALGSQGSDLLILGPKFLT